MKKQYFYILASLNLYSFLRIQRWLWKQDQLKGENCRVFKAQKVVLLLKTDFHARLGWA